MWRTWRSSSDRARAVGAGLALVWVVACGAGGGFAGPSPVASLASSPQAKTAFEAIRSAWTDRDRSPADLRVAVDTFLLRFPHDGLAPLARVFLALTALRQGDGATADAALAQTARLPPGTAHDFWTIARAKRLRLQGQPEAAIGLLRPGIGKEVDPLARALFQEELTLTAIATDRDYEAVSYMDAWLRASSDEERRDTIERVSALVDRLPKEVLIGALQAMRAQRMSLGYGAEIERILSERLVRIATETDDPELARMLTDADAGAVVLTGDAGTALGELATSRRGLNVVEGRTVGLLLPTGSFALRDESADVLRGFMWALGLPRGAFHVSTPVSVTRGASPSEPCAALEEAPDDAWTPDDPTRLVTRNDNGGGDRTEESLDELAGEGASVIVAGLDPRTAAHALRWSEQHGVAVIVLVAPDEAAPSTSFGFQAGEERARVAASLEHAAPALAGDAVARVVDASELLPAALPSSDGGASAPRDPPVSCDSMSGRAGDPRFPVGSWVQTKMAAWFVSGSANCAVDVLGDLDRAHIRGVVGLTLEAASLPPHSSTVRVVSAQAGVLPAPARGDPRTDAVRRFSALTGALGWWTALGRDASTLARVAVHALPLDEVSDLRAVRERRSLAKDSLASAKARLWTSESVGFAPDHSLPRAICAVEVPAEGR
jgi:hypothetical protein